MGRRRRISVTARATKDRVMHYPSAFSEAFAEALLAASDGEREGGGSGGREKTASERRPRALRERRRRRAKSPGAGRER